MLKTQATRLLGAAWLVIGLAACDGSLTPTPPPQQPPQQPAPPPPPPPALTRTVSGTVLEFRATGERVPVANLRLKVRGGESDGAVRATPLADTVTDARGRYTINTSAFVLFFQADPESEYRFLCDWFPIVLSVPITDLPVVHTTWSGNRPPPGMWFVQWSGAWGTVSEQIDESVQPVAGATVILDDARPDPPATTGPNGFYMICSVVGGVETGQGPRTLVAFKTGYNSVTRDYSDGSGVHLQLTRR